MICLDDVAVSFGDLSVLDGVGLTVAEGEFVGLVGPNGAGKTTLLRTANGYLDPDSGTVTVDGDPLTDLSSKEVSRRVGTLPQEGHVGFSFTAEQLVEMGRTPYRSRLDWSGDTEAVERAMARTETRQFRDRPVDELSGGERQRVLLARALAQDAPTLLLDEPTASLDINHQVQVLDMVEQSVAEGTAALAAIHDLDLAARYCDRLLLLSEGEIRSRGPPRVVLADDTLGDAFGTTTVVTDDPVSGTPRMTALAERPTRDQTVHVVGGGSGGRTALGTLWRAGYELSVGPVPAGDVTATLADHLDVHAVTVPAFERPTARQRREWHRLARRADAVVVTGGPGTDLFVEEGGPGSLGTTSLLYADVGTDTSGPAPQQADGGAPGHQPDSAPDEDAATVGTESGLREAVAALTDDSADDSTTNKG